MNRVSFENLAARTEKGRLPRARRRLGLPSRKTRQKRGPIDSTAIGADWLGTDTQSFVSVAVSEARPRFATHFATDQRLGSAESVSNSRPVGKGGRGSVRRAGGGDSVPVSASGILLANAPAGHESALSNPVCWGVRARKKTAGGTIRLEPTAE